MERTSTKLQIPQSVGVLGKGSYPASHESLKMFLICILNTDFETEYKCFKKSATDYATEHKRS